MIDALRIETGNSLALSLFIIRVFKLSSLLLTFSTILSIFIVLESIISWMNESDYRYNNVWLLKKGQDNKILNLSLMNVFKQD